MDASASPSDINFRRKVVIRNIAGCTECGAGAPGIREEMMHASEVTVYKLLQIATEASRCVNCLSSKTVPVIACTRIPGGGPWVLAKSPNLRVYASEDITLPEVKLKISLDDNELAIERKLGAPVSVSAAWAEALFEHVLSGEDVTFHAGAGIKCAVTNAFRDGMTNIFSQESPFGFPQWFEPEIARDLMSKGSRCYVEPDYSVISEQICKEAIHLGLKVINSNDDSVTVGQLDGVFEDKVLTMQVAGAAISQGMSAATTALGYLEAINRIQLGLESELREISMATDPSSIVLTADRLVELQFEEDSIHVDVDAYSQSDPGQKAALIKGWQARANRA